MYIFVAIITAICIFYLYDFLKKKNQIKRILSQCFPEDYEEILHIHFHPYPFLSPIQKDKLNKKILLFLEFKNFWPLGDMTISLEMKILIAAQACLLVIKDKELIPFPDLTNIYISQGPYREKENNFLNPRTLQPLNSTRLGESWLKGPLVLSWENVEQDLRNWKGGHNVVYHEFTHQLDGSDGKMNAFPILEGAHEYKLWRSVMARNLLELKEHFKRHQKSDIDFYGLTNDAEFFAVTVESFFAHSKILEKKHPDLYQLYKDYFQLDPARWG